MTNRYFGTARKEVFAYLPQQCERVLEIGCGDGATLAAIKEQRTVAWAAGLERDPDAAAKARTIADVVWEANAEDADFESEIAPSSLDVVLCLDVLEHLVNPWRLVERIAPLLKPSGRLIVSVPNIRHYKFIWNLFFKGDFHYREAGLLDRTHLRFFVRATAIDLATRGGLRLITCANAHPPRAGDTRWILSKLTGGGVDPLITKQYVVVSTRG